jgi:succinate-semialdehyde dehydrogenase/glutarate-semialdehyde dehydrogenase
MQIELKDSSLFRQAAYIDGAWSSMDTSERIEVFKPANGEKLGEVPRASVADTRRAIAAAETALVTWRKTTAKERSAILRRFHDLVLENKEDLALIMTLEQGRPIKEALGEIAYGASYIEWFAEEAKRSYGDVIPTHRTAVRHLVLKEPLGVVASITPWNFPSAMLARKIAPALAAGCTMVSKPSELTPFSALALAVLAERAGLPKGVWNIINGEPSEIGTELTRNTAVKKVSFTGSTRVGKLLMRQCADSVKKLSLELGGNAPFIVFASADIDKAVSGAIMAKYRNNGQTCVCANRFYVHDSVVEEFQSKLATAVSELQVGDGIDTATDLGPLINDAAVDKVTSHINDAVAKGAKVLCGGKLKHSLFFEPTVVTDATSNMLLAKEETFGPLAAIFSFSEEAEVVELANNTEYGLAAYFYSLDHAQIWRVAESLEAGMVGINEGILSSELIPFGGIKQSGFGREGSKYGLDDYLQIKYLCMGGL